MTRDRHNVAKQSRKGTLLFAAQQHFATDALDSKSRKPYKNLLTKTRQRPLLSTYFCLLKILNTMTLLGADAGFKIGSPSAAAASSEPSQMNMSLGESRDTRVRRFVALVHTLSFLCKIHPKGNHCFKCNPPLTCISPCLL